MVKLGTFVVTAFAATVTKTIDVSTKMRNGWTLATADRVVRG